MVQNYRFANAADDLKRAVWQKARLIAGYDPATWRHDACGAPIRYGDHGNRNSAYGWEIDHIVPVSKGGGSGLANLQPLQWENNLAKGDSSKLMCAVPRRAA